MVRNKFSVLSALVMAGAVFSLHSFNAYADDPWGICDNVRSQCSQSIETWRTALESCRTDRDRIVKMLQDERAERANKPAPTDEPRPRSRPVPTSITGDGYFGEVCGAALSRDELNNRTPEDKEHPGLIYQAWGDCIRVYHQLSWRKDINGKMNSILIGVFSNGDMIWEPNYTIKGKNGKRCHPLVREMSNGEVKVDGCI